MAQQKKTNDYDHRKVERDSTRLSLVKSWTWVKFLDVMQSNPMYKILY